MYLSILFGLLISIILFYVISNRKLIIIDGNIVEKKMKTNGKCYMIKPESTSCDIV
jgi:hypothetical protein